MTLKKFQSIIIILSVTLIFAQFGTNVTLCQNGSGAVNNEWTAIKSSSGRLASFRRRHCAAAFRVTLINDQH